MRSNRPLVLYPPRIRARITARRKAREHKHATPLKLILMHWSTAFLIFFIALYFWGCMPQKEVIKEVQEVKIPVRCQVVMPSRPESVKNPVEMNLLILKYIEQLEIALKECL